MEEQTAVEEDKKVWSLLVNDMLFGLAGKPRKWEDWKFSQPLQERRIFVFNTLKETIKADRKKNRLACKQAIILARHFKLLETEPLEIQELYLQVFVMTEFMLSGPNSFSNLIENPFLFEEQLFWRQIAVHNLSLSHEFQKYNLNWEHWLNYPPARFESRVNNENQDVLWAKLNQELDALVAMFANHSLQPSLRKDCIAIKKMKKEILAGELVLLRRFFPRFFPLYYKTLDYLKKKGQPISDLLSKFERPDLIKQLILELGEIKSRNFIIKLWERDFGNLYSGNYIGNCLAIGNKGSCPVITLPGVPGEKRPAGILDYLVDKGIQVVEIMECKNGDEYYVGQCYLYVFLDNGKPVLMADSIDFRPIYQLSRRKSLNFKIRTELFKFLMGYASAIGIERVVIAKNGPILESGKNKGERHVIGNDVDVSDLLEVNFEKIEKLGGYWNHQPYFLESVGGTEAFVIR
ncbi:MAG: hypothetical protein HYY86_02635 [Candidatus Harrisonbacteria bacterium]|nr:hypothetical protein [Candidatus Harrisonbacteria bacterium]